MPDPTDAADGTWGGIDFNAVQLLVHHQRRDVGSCICGWGVDTGHLGQSHPLHVWRELQRAVLPDHDARVRADERARVAEAIASDIEATNHQHAAGCECDAQDAQAIAAAAARQHAEGDHRG